MRLTTWTPTFRLRQCLVEMRLTQRHTNSLARRVERVAVSKERKPGARVGDQHRRAGGIEDRTATFRRS